MDLINWRTIGKWPESGSWLFSGLGLITLIPTAVQEKSESMNELENTHFRAKHMCITFMLAMVTRLKSFQEKVKKRLYDSDRGGVRDGIASVVAKITFSWNSRILYYLITN